MTIEKISSKKTAWLENVYAPAVKKRAERKPRFTTLSGEPIEPLYTAEDLGGFDGERDLGAPGDFPYTRGIHPSMYRTRLWTMRQFAGFGSAEDTNRRFHYLMQHGVTGLSTAFDMPTLMGRDADDPLSRGEVGREGVAVSTLRDVEILFDRIPVDEITTSMTINGPASIVWALYLAAAEKRGYPLSALGGTIQNDCLKEYIAQREWIIPERPAMDLVIDSLRFGAREVPKWNAVSVSGYHMREAGARRGARRDAVAAHELARRDVRAADGGGGDARAADAADHRPRDRRGRHGRSARRLVLPRAPHPSHGGGLREVPARDRGHGWDGPGRRTRLPAARDH